MISVETITKTWQRIAEYPIDRVPELIYQMRVEQPVLMAYLLRVEPSTYDKDEQETIFYIGMVVWQIMKQSELTLGRLSQRKLRQVEADNNRVLDLLSTDTEADFISATANMIENYPEPEVLRYIVEAIMEEDDGGDPQKRPIRDENKGLAFIHLKVALDSLIRCLKH